MVSASEFKNKTVFVTGSSSGIGRGVVKSFAALGARVAINYPNEQDKPNAELVLKEIFSLGGEGIIVKGDVSSESDVENMFGEVLREFSDLDILVNNAGVAKASLVEDTSLTDWEHTIGVHLRGVFLCTRKVLPLMYERNYGRIINTASQLAYKGAPGFSHYAAAKGAILSFTRSLALEIGDRKVTVNCVAPGATMTPMLENVPKETLEAIRMQIPNGRIADVDDIVGAYMFLASAAAGHFQGQCLSPNGGDVFL